MSEIAIEIIDKVKAAAQASLKTHHEMFLSPVGDKPGAVISSGRGSSGSRESEPIIAIGSSTGGTEAISKILKRLPADSRGIVIVQHMPPGFTRNFAERLDNHCQMHVKEAVSGDLIAAGTALISPGDRHLLVSRNDNGQYVAKLRKGELVNRHRPSVDVLFRSVAKIAGPNAVGVILTGMGSDGAEGLSAMKEMGASTIAQDEASCVVFGMPKSAIQLGCVDQVLSLDEIPRRILALSGWSMQQAGNGFGKVP